MREVLFRGKRTDNWEWIEGSLLGIDWCDKPSTYSIAPNTPVSVFYSVIPETVGQYTGLTDKNGVKIFEGDILKTFGYIYVIMWDSTRALFYLRDPVYRVTSDFYYYFGSDLSVIGNIHDNPDILKGGGDNG